jgi:hypothetical protein
MLNFCEQPWTLLTVAAFCLLVAVTVRQMAPDKSRWWQFAAAGGLAVFAVGMDLLVKTDFEKINALIAKGLRTVQEQDTDGLSGLISARYTDSFHSSKDILMAHCRTILAKEKIRKTVKLNQKIDPSATHTRTRVSTTADASAQLKVLIRLDEQHSKLAQLTGKNVFTAEIMLYLVKASAGNWQIISSEVLKIDEQSVKWGQIAI